MHIVSPSFLFEFQLNNQSVLLKLLLFLQKIYNNEETAYLWQLNLDDLKGMNFDRGSG